MDSMAMSPMFTTKCKNKEVRFLNLKRSLAFALSLLLVFGVVAPVFAAGGRISGSDRYATAVEISKDGWESSEYVVLASGVNFPDALAGVPLAHQLGAPILLTEKGVLTAATKAEIQRLAAEKVYILGGSAAVSEVVENSLKALGLEITRIKGDDRYHTAARIAEKVAELAGGVTSAVVAYGGNFPDALAAASYAAQKGMPILLTATGSLPDKTAEALEELGIEETVVVGGPSVVSAGVFALLPGATRVYGSDRYATALALAKHFGTGKSVYIATGEKFADAITGAALAAKNGTGILLVGKTLPDALVAFLADIDSATIFGGTSAVSAAVASAIENALGKEVADATEIEIISAQATSNTQVRVVLADAPLKNLAPTDFKISPALAITSVTTADNIATLTTASQSAIKYTITPAKGTGSATFTGVAAAATVGSIKSIRFLNLRQIQVDFTQPVYWLGNADTFSNYYEFLTESGPDLQSQSLEYWWEDDGVIISHDGQLTAAEAAKATSTVNYIVFEFPSAWEWSTEQYFQTLTIQARNIEAAKGGYIHTSQGTFVVKDDVKPTVLGVEVLYPGTPGFEGLEPEVLITFSEPLFTTYDADWSDFRVYIDGVIQTTDKIGEFKILTNESVEEGTLLSFKVGDLEEDVDHQIKVVGAMDLNYNLQTPGTWAGKFKVVSETATDPSYTRPKVESIEQIADNMLEIVFDRKDVAPVEGSDSLVIKTAYWNDTEWVDLVVDGIESENTLDKKKTVWTATFDAVFTKDENAEGEFNYDGQDKMIRKVVVQNYAIGGQPAGWEGQKYSKDITFINDKAAPVVSGKYYDIAGGVLYIEFKDDPWGGIIEETEAEGNVLVSMTTKAGVTYQEYVDFEDIDVVDTALTVGPKFAANTYIAIPLDEEGKLVDNGKLIREAVYTVTLPSGLVQDVADEPEIRVRDQHPNVAGKLSISIPKADAPDAAEGRVPQTAAGMIQSGRDMEVEDPLAIDWDGSATDVGSIGYMILPENQNKIIVVFDGQVEAASAVKKANYTFDGKALPLAATITYHEGPAHTEVYGNKGELGEDVGFVIITLPAGTVELTGWYEVTVKGITNNHGKLMLPVKTEVRLVDNTPPKPVQLKIIGSKQLELTFDEQVLVDGNEIDDINVAIGNLIAQIGNHIYVIESITRPADGNLKKLIITVTQDFETVGKATVTILNNVSGEMLITDLEGNAVVPNTKITN